MDPNSLSNLDPKLKETYERVMGTSSPSSSSTQPPPSVDTAAPDPQPVAVASSLPPLPPASTPDPMTQSPLTGEQQPAAANPSQPAAANSTFIKPIGKQSGHGGLIKVFYVLGGAVFFTIYVMFWMRILNVPLPF